MEELERAVAAVIDECLRVREGEAVLVIANPATREIGELLRAEAEGSGADAVLALMRERAGHGAEPAATIAAAMQEADVILAPTVQSLSHSSARKRASDRGARVATLPGVTAEMLARVMSADMESLRRRSHAVAQALSAATEARVTCPHGSDLRLDLSGRTAIPDAGELGEPGAFGNLPCGEGFVSPVQDRGEGRLVVDGTIAGIGIPREPIELTVEGGHLTAASGPEGEELLRLLGRHGTDGTSVAELGIGTNERATLTDDLLEAEKILGSAHVAFGASAGIGGTVQVPVHIDCVVMKPDVTLDGEPLVQAGRLLV